LENFYPHTRVLPCMACGDCFDNFLKHTSALGKPELKCPGMNCGIQLDEDHVHKIAPVGLANYRLAILKYKFKQCYNFKFCPNSDCGHGFEIDNACATADDVQCPKCRLVFCPNCAADPHPGATCEENKKNQFALIWGALGEEHVYMQNESKQCPFCLVWIEKNGGCQHMTCHHCRGEFCWHCFGNWRGHSTCEKPIKIVREQFSQVVPYVRWLHGKPSIRLRKHIFLELQYHSQLAYQRFNLGWHLEGDEDSDEIDEICVVKLNPEYEGDDKPEEVDNWELDIYGDEWESDDEFDWAPGSEIWIIPNNRYICRATIVKENDVNEIYVQYESNAYPEEWIRKNATRIIIELPKNISPNSYVTYEQEMNYHDPNVVEEEESEDYDELEEEEEEEEEQSSEGTEIDAEENNEAPAAPEAGAEIEEEQVLQAQVEQALEEPDFQPQPSLGENSVGGENLDEEQDKDGGGALKETKPVEDIKAPEPMYIYEWVPKPPVEDVITQQNYFQWIQGFIVEDEDDTEMKRDPADQSVAVEDEKAEEMVEENVEAKEEPVQEA